MVIIYNNRIEEEGKNPSQIIKIKDNILHLTLLIDTALEKYKELTIDLNTIDEDTRYSVLSYREGYSPFFLNEYKDDTLNLDNSALVYFKSSTGDINIQLSYDTDIDEESDAYDLHEPVKHLRTELMKKYPSYKQKQEEKFLHNVIKDHIDNNLSLSYIDSQLELISDLIFKIIDKYPLNKSDNEYIENIKTIIKNTSLLNIKPVDKVLNELNTSKTTIRALQEKYYKQKAKYNADAEMEQE